MRRGAQQVLDSFCGLYTREPRQVAWHAHHNLGGQMLVEAAFVALPHANGVEVRYLLLCDTLLAAEKLFQCCLAVLLLAFSSSPRKVATRCQ